MAHDPEDTELETWKKNVYMCVHKICANYLPWEDLLLG